MRRSEAFNFFESDSGKSIIQAEAEGLEQGFHGFHIHENGVCEPDAEGGAFTSAEGHFSPDEHQHGHHTADMPPLYASGDGTVFMRVQMDSFTPEELISSQTSVVIHADPDNFAHIPERYQSSEQDEPGPDETTRKTGDAGERIACGVVASAE